MAKNKDGNSQNSYAPAGLPESYIQRDLLSTASGIVSIVGPIDFMQPFHFVASKESGNALDVIEGTGKFMKPVKEKEPEEYKDFRKWYFKAIKRNLWLRNGIVLMILGVVLGLLSFGGLMSYKQLFGLKNVQPAIEFTISNTKIFFNSNIVGLAILILSLVFFLAYINKVFKLFNEKPWYTKSE